MITVLSVNSMMQCATINYCLRMLTYCCMHEPLNPHTCTETVEAPEEAISSDEQEGKLAMQANLHMGLISMLARMLTQQCHPFLSLSS